MEEPVPCSASFQSSQNRHISSRPSLQVLRTTILFNTHQKESTGPRENFSQQDDTLLITASRIHARSKKIKTVQRQTDRSGSMAGCTRFETELRHIFSPNWEAINHIHDYTVSTLCTIYSKYRLPHIQKIQMYKNQNLSMPTRQITAMLGRGLRGRLNRSPELIYFNLLKIEINYTDVLTQSCSLLHCDAEQ